MKGGKPKNGILAYVERNRCRVILCFSLSICLLFEFLIARTLENYINLKAHVKSTSDPAFSLNLNTDKKFILLVASFRSGSTFVGQIFDRNPNFQYLFEPFHERSLKELYQRGSIVGARADHSLSDLRMLYLQQVLHNCSVYPTVIVREHHEYCGTVQEHLRRFNETRCVLRLLKKGVSHQEICRYRGVVVMKVIRLSQLRDLDKIAGIRSADVKIIHLVRHPFPMMMSRRTGLEFFMWNQRTTVEWSRNNIPVQRIKSAWEAYDYCFQTLKSIDFVEGDVWWKERYLRVTHEEISLMPVETAEGIYDFIGETFPGGVRDYLEEISSGDNKKPGPLNIYRNSSMIADKWKYLPSDLLTYWDLYSIEAQCKEFLRTFEYNPEFQIDGVSIAKQFHIF